MGISMSDSPRLSGRGGAGWGTDKGVTVKAAGHSADATAQSKGLQGDRLGPCPPGGEGSPCQHSKTSGDSSRLSLRCPDLCLCKFVKCEAAS